jgi:hypothetical protein
MAKKTPKVKSKVATVASKPKLRNRTLAILQGKYPNLSKFEISYQGSGDSFDSFDDYTAYDKKGNVDLPLSSQLEKLFETDDFEAILWKIIDSSEADFNNDGSRGTITFDLEEDKIVIDNYYYEMVTNSSGELEWTDELADDFENDSDGSMEEEDKRVEDI